MGIKGKKGPNTLFETLNILDRLPEIEMLYRNHIYDKDVAPYIGCSERLIFNWLKWSVKDINTDFADSGKDKYDPKYTAFAEARTRGKLSGDIVVENTAIAVAMGTHVHKETVVWFHEGQLYQRDIEKYYPAKFESLNKVLQNRRGSKYGNQLEVTHSGSLDSNVRFLEGATPEMLEELKRFAQQEIAKSSVALVDDYISRDDEDGDLDG